MARIGKAAIKWARDNAKKPPAGLGSGSNSAHPHSWYRMCAQFVDRSLGGHGGQPNAGAQWDHAQHRVRVDSCTEIPAGYPVYWETSGVDDHVALKVGGLGSPLVRSTDAATPGEADVIDGDKLTTKWRMQLLGFTRDINGMDVTRPDDPLLHPAEPAKPTPEKRARSRGTRIDNALREARSSKRGTGERAKRINAAIVALKRIPFLSQGG